MLFIYAFYCLVVSHCIAWTSEGGGDGGGGGGVVERKRMKVNVLLLIFNYCF